MSDINRYTYEQISLGQKVSFSIVITNEMMMSFYGITGDYNPLHIDDDFAKSAKGGYAERLFMAC